MQPPDLIDDLLRLRLLTEDDIESLERSVIDPEIRRWFPSRRTGRELYANKMQEWHDESLIPLAILDDGAFVGHIFLELTGDDTAVVSYWLLPEGRGRGIATRALKLASKWALGTLKLARVELWVVPGNQRSQAVAMRAGYVYEGTLRSAGVQDGQRFDKQLFSLLPTDPLT